jgi:hypothetical protein
MLNSKAAGGRGGLVEEQRSVVGYGHSQNGHFQPMLIPYLGVLRLRGLGQCVNPACHLI